MDPIKARQRLGFLTQRILALPEALRPRCMAECKQYCSPEQFSELKQLLREQQESAELFNNEDYLPLGNAQRIFWSIELTSGYSKHEITSTFLYGKLNLEKLQQVLDYVLKQFDIFSFHVSQWLPYAHRLPQKNTEIHIIELDSSKPQEQQLDEINHKLEHLDLRKLKQNVYPCLVKISDNEALLHLVITHKCIDAKTKSLIWEIIKERYHDDAAKEFLPYRDYLLNERRYFTHLAPFLQQHVATSYTSFSPCQIRTDIIDLKTSVKKRILYELNPQQVSSLKAFAQKYEFTLDELIISATLKAFKSFCVNQDFLIQLISQPYYYPQYNQTVGPCLNERAFALRCTQDDLMAITKGVSQNNRDSLNYSNLPYGAGLGWLFFNKYPFSASLISGIIRGLTCMSKYTRLSKATADCYAGLICYEFFANKKKDFPLLSFNFRHAITLKKNKDVENTEALTFKPYFYPLYHNPQNFVSINIDSTEDEGLIIHLETYFRKEVDQEIMEHIIRNLNGFSV